MSFDTQSDITAIAKELYPQTDINKLMIEDSPLLGLVKKRTDFYGKYQRVALRYAMPTGRSRQFTNAQQNQGPSSLSGFNVTRAKDYAVASIDTETIRSSRNDKGAIVEALDLELSGAMEAIRRNLAISMFRNNGGSIGRLSGSGSSQTSTTCTLSQAADISNFEVGQYVQFATTDGTSGSVRGGNLKITAIDRDNGTFTVASAPSTLGVLDNDYVFIDGDFGNSLAGLDAWIPSSVSSTAFFGVDRTTDKDRLAGLRPPTTSGAPYEQTLLTAVGYMARQRSKPSHCLMNNQDWQSLVISLGSRSIFIQEETDTPEVGYAAVQLAGPKGMLKVLADPNCQKSTSWILQLDTWCFWTLGEIGFLMEDGMRLRAEPSADAYQFRIGYFGNLVCDAPGWNARVTL